MEWIKFGDGRTAFPKPRGLSPRHLANCRVVPDRYELMRQLPKGGVVGEIGTQRGDFARFILSECSPDELHIFDYSFEQRDHPFDKAFFASQFGVSLHEGDSSTCLSRLPDEMFDWLYIDGDHSFEGVSADIEQAAKKIRRGGLLIFNDYTVYSWHEGLPYGVQQAVNNLMLDQDFEAILLALGVNGYPDICLRRINF